MAGWAAASIDAVPVVRDGDPGDPVWHPLQHHLGLSAFGANVFVAAEGTETLVEQHDERSSGQQELYLVLEGEAEFELDGERMPASRGTVVAVTEPSVTRSAVARAPGTALLVVGAGDGPFASTWHVSHFADVPKASR